MKLFYTRVLALFFICLFLVSASSCFAPTRLQNESESAIESSTVQASPDESQKGTSDIQISIQTINPGILTVGLCPGMRPYSYYENAQIVGFDVDLISGICNALDLDVKIVTMDFEDLFSACKEKQVDCVMGMEYSDIRAEALFFVSYMTETLDGEKFDIGLYTNSSNLADTLLSVLDTFMNNGSYSNLVKEYFPSNFVA